MGRGFASVTRCVLVGFVESFQLDSEGVSGFVLLVGPVDVVDSWGRVAFRVLGLVEAVFGVRNVGFVVCVEARNRNASDRSA